ncbi:hypothetical protein HQ560_01785 [bacterium]|nr:hypothetical protein [bacterium]
MLLQGRRARRMTLCALLGALALLVGDASAASCPHCLQKYPEPAPWKGEKDRVAALRAAHEKVCKTQQKGKKPKTTPPEKQVDPKLLDEGKRRTRDLADFQRGGDLGVLTAARSYANGGGYVPRPWEGHGVPEDVTLHDADKTPIRRADPKKGTYCCGFTFAVVMKAARNRGLLVGKPRTAVERFAKEWYGSTAPSAEKQCVLAMENLRLGEEVQPKIRDIRRKALRPGDFVMFWRRNGGGHSVVFLDWARDAKGRIIGMRYRSSQSGTNGIGDTVEYFQSPPGRSPRGLIDPQRAYAGRLHKPARVR